MGPVVTAKAARDSRRTGRKLRNCVDNLKVLTDKTNHMALRRSRRNVASPLTNMGSGQKPCVYKDGNTAKNQVLPPEERLALYTFEVDECDIQPKKSRHKRNVRQRKKNDMSDTVDNEYIPTINVKKRLRPGTNCIVTRQKKQLSTVAVTADSQCQNKGVALQKDDTVAVTGSSLNSLSPDVTHHDSVSHRKTAIENKENIVFVDKYSTCQVASVSHIEPRNIMTENKSIISAADRHVTIHQKADISTNLTDDCELNFSVESDPAQVSSLCANSLLISPVRRFSRCMTIRRPGKSKENHGIQSAADFTIDNYFGFDEEPENDLRFSLSEVKLAPIVKPVMPVSFLISSTPNPKPSFIRPEIKPMRSVKGRTKPSSTTLLPVQPATVPPDMTLPDTAKAGDSPCPVIYEEEDVPMQHFMKPARRSYERPLRSYQESYCDDSLSEDEASSKKESKRSKKARVQMEKTLEKWAANVSAEFDEIDSFKLFVE